MSVFRKRGLLAMCAVAAALTLTAVDYAEARRGGSIGSRGSRTWQAPAATPTAPGTAAPIQRSTTPQPGPQAASQAAARPNAAAARPSMFGSGFGGALMRGLLIGGLVGLLLGNGLGGLAGILGFLLQAGLLALGVMLVLRLMRGRQPVAAGAGAAGAGSGAPAGPVPPTRPGAIPVSGGGRGAPARPAASPPKRSDEIGITPRDLEAFERLLGTIQTAFGREDQAELKENTTPEMFGHLVDELRENAERGVRNEVSDVKLLQGDLAEAWREGSQEYATVAMRYASRDAMVDRASGRPVSGDAAGASESTEVWTFVRERGGDWRLSAIQGS